MLRYDLPKPILQVPLPLCLLTPTLQLALIILYVYLPTPTSCCSLLCEGVVEHLVHVRLYGTSTVLYHSSTYFSHGPSSMNIMPCLKNPARAVQGIPWRWSSWVNQESNRIIGSTFRRSSPVFPTVLGRGGTDGQAKRPSFIKTAVLCVDGQGPAVLLGTGSAGRAWLSS